MFDPFPWDKQIQQCFVVVVLNKFEPEERSSSCLSLCITRLRCFQSDIIALKLDFLHWWMTALTDSLPLCFCLVFHNKWSQTFQDDSLWIWADIILYKSLGIKHMLLFSHPGPHSTNYYHFYFVIVTNLFSTLLFICQKGSSIFIKSPWFYSTLLCHFYLCHTQETWHCAIKLKQEVFVIKG